MMPPSMALPWYGESWRPDEQTLSSAAPDLDEVFVEHTLKLSRKLGYEAHAFSDSLASLVVAISPRRMT